MQKQKIVFYIQKWTPNFGQPFKCILLLYVAA
jgi:hypothetical protein